MIIFVVLGILILAVSFIVAFASLIYEQKESIDAKGSLKSISQLPQSSGEIQPIVSVQPDIAALSDTGDIKEDKTQKEDHLKTAAREIFPWEQDEENTTGSGEDFFVLQQETNPSQKLNGEISLRDIAGKS